MNGERIERAVGRIEAALARIAAVADSERLAAPSQSGSGDGDERLRSTARDALRDLDALIEGLER